MQAVTPGKHAPSGAFPPMAHRVQSSIAEVMMFVSALAFLAIAVGALLMGTGSWGIVVAGVAIVVSLASIISYWRSSPDHAR